MLDETYSPDLIEQLDYSQLTAKRYRARLTKKGYLKYLSHLDWQNTLVKALFRSQLKLAFTEGFNPIPKVSLGAALPIFVEGDGEFIEFEIYDDLKINEIQGILNKVLDKNAQISEIKQIEKPYKSLDTIVQLSLIHI